MIKLLKYNYKIYNIFREEATLALAKLMIKLLKYNYKIYNIFREEATLALAGFHAAPLSWSNWNLEMLGFCGGRKTREPKEKPLKQGENQRQTQPTYGTRRKLNLAQIVQKPINIT